MQRAITYELIHKDKRTGARSGVIHTPHGDVRTPVFMPVGTQATVKAMKPEDVAKLGHEGAHIILGNTYHLYLRPGHELVRQAGGLHKFMNWDRAILTDSGGFQVFSLGDLRKITEEGVSFRSYIDGSKHMFTPESSMEVQNALGADIIMAFDECAPGTSDYKYAQEAMGRTHRWLDRCLKRYNETEPQYGYYQSLFPIVQGCTYKDLREESAEFIASKDCDGHAIGGLAVGEPTEVMYEMIEIVNAILPKDKPRYLMGVGTPANLLEAISRGVDMFDCVIPTRVGRHGMLYTSEGIINIKNERWKYDFSPIDENGTVYVDHQYNKAYLRHLVISKELLGPMIATVHNLGFYLWLVKEARKHIIEGDFTEWRDMMLPKVMNRIS